MIKKCDYKSCDKFDYYFKECCLKYLYLKKAFEKRLNFNKKKKKKKK